MSTVQRINFEPTTDIMPVHRRDFPLATPDLASPLNPAVITDGEWVTLNSSYQILRASNLGVVGNPASLRSWPVFAERGRYDVQAIAGRKMPILFLGHYEFDTRIYDDLAVVAGGAAITFVGQKLKVATITLGTRNYTGLVGVGGGNTDPVVGIVTRLPSAGKLRFIQAWA